MKQLYAVAAVLAAVLLLCACNANNAELPNEIKSQDGSVTIDTPDSWSAYEAAARDNLVLAVTDKADAFAQIFWFPSVEGKAFTAKDYADKALEYYGDDAQSAVTSVDISGNTGYYFAYLKQGIDKDGNTYSYQGYEYFLTMKSGSGEAEKIGVAEVDIFYRYTDTAPTNDQLAQLRMIAETVQAKE